MASHAKLVAFDVSSSGMWVVTIGAFHALVIHLALDERSVDVDLVVDLPVHVIGGGAHVGSPRLGYLGEEVIEEFRTDVMPGMNEPATSMAFGTGLDLNLVGTVHVGEAVVGHSLPAIVCFGHFNVLPARSVASLTGNGHLGIGSRELLSTRIESLAKVGGMTVGAHMVPVLHGSSPKERVVRLDVLIRVNVIPTLTFDVPASGQDLHATVGELNEILLQRFPTEGVLHLKNLHVALLVFRFHHVLVIFPEKTRDDTVTLEGRIVEIATHGFRGGQLHGMKVMRTLPLLVLLRMTLNASRNSHVLVETRISDRIN